MHGCKWGLSLRIFYTVKSMSKKFEFKNKLMKMSFSVSFCMSWTIFVKVGLNFMFNDEVVPFLRLSGKITS